MQNALPDYRPDTSNATLGIGLIGCGSIAQKAHLPAYKKYGFPVIGAFDVFPAALESAVAEFGVHPFGSLEELLADERVKVVDVAVRTEDRYPVIQQALRAGKHVLSQKPFASTIDEARDLVRMADELSLTIAVNQNGRWAPSWRAATLWLDEGAIGEVVALTHVFTVSFAWTIPVHFNEMEHFVIYDYAAHWFDITRCWLAGKHITSVRSWDTRSPIQPTESHTPWNMTAEIACSDGTIATILGTGTAAEATTPSHHFEIVGTEGSVRGEVLSRERVELDRGGARVEITPEFEWFPDGFAGSMGELQSSVAQKREPYNSGKHVLASLELGLAAVESADNAGARMGVDIQA
jgi:predicted dehydrogenase